MNPPGQCSARLKICPARKTPPPRATVPTPCSTCASASVLSLTNAAAAWNTPTIKRTRTKRPAGDIWSQWAATNSSMPAHISTPPRTQASSTGHRRPPRRSRSASNARMRCAAEASMSRASIQRSSDRSQFFGIAWPHHTRLKAGAITRGAPEGSAQRGRGCRGGPRLRPRPILAGELPSPSQRLVELDEGGQAVEASLGEGVLGGEELLLGLQDLEVVGEAPQVTGVGEADRLAIRVHGAGLLFLDVGELLVGDQGGRDFGEGVGHALLVLGLRQLPAGDGGAVLVLQAPSLEQGGEKAAAGGPGPSLPEEVRHLRRHAAERPREADRWEEVRDGDADIGVRRHELLLGLAQVGPALQKLGGESGRDVRREDLVVEARPAGDGAGVPPQQEAEQV